MSYIKIKNPECRIIISQPIRRTDNGKATLTLNSLNKFVAEFHLDKTDNSNIDDASCLGKRGLQLNNTGTGKLALNLIKVLKAFCNIDFARKSLSSQNSKHFSLKAPRQSIKHFVENKCHSRRNLALRERIREFANSKAQIDFFSMLLI